MNAFAGKAIALILLIVFTLISGYGDAQGFYHSARVWSGGRLVWREAGLATAGYIFGVLAYWVALRFLNQVANVPAEVQTMGWFAVTIVGVALLNGGFLKWGASDRLVALVVLAGLTWLLARTA